jgi:glycosyltransferase involved in cell wall biosynthesis
LKVDIVIPIYNEQENLTELYDRLTDVFDNLNGIMAKVIYVNDGSNDDSLEIMLDQCKNDSRFSIIDLSRNFGHQAAITAGMANTDSNATIIMDGDLQDPPELIPELIGRWEKGALVVRVQRESRKERGIRRLGFEGFHKLFNLVSDFQIPSNTGIFSLIDRKVVKELNRLEEKNRFLPGLRSWVGFSQDVIFHDRLDRVAGKPKQTLRRLFKYAFDAIFSFSYKPLRIMTAIGLVISVISFIMASFFVIRRILGIEIAQTGFTTLVTLVLFLGGVQLIAIGLVGEYLARVYDEVKERPLFIVKKIYNSNSHDSEE